MDEEFPNPFDDEVKQFVPPQDTESWSVVGKEKPVEAALDETIDATAQPATLTDEMKKFLDEHWKDMDLMEMTRHIFKDDNLKGSSREGRTVRTYLVAKGYKVKTTGSKKEDVELNEQNKEFILKYAKDMKPYEMARVIFANETLHQFGKEAMAVQKYLKETSPALLAKDDEYTDETYIPPKTFKSTLKRICEVTSLNIEEDKINVKVKKAIETCINFLQTPRFVLTVTNYKNVSEREIFESEYVRSVWDKPDLTTDEINLYISLVNEYVIQDRLHRIMSKLNLILENVTKDPDGRISIALSDSIKGKSEELHRSLSRQQDFTTLLTGKRADRQKLQTARSKSLVSLVEAFREEKERLNSVRIAEFRKKKVEDEIHRLENEDEWNARIFGVTKEEILE